MRSAAVSFILLLALASCGKKPVPRGEHPRPDFQRSEWLSLNGAWEFRFDPQDRGLDEGWQRSETPWPLEITVPFCWESKLSGVHDLSGQQIGWYRRKIDIPSAWAGKHVWIRFEAVDWEAQVWVNGAPVGKHEGGYTPFAFDITKYAQPGETATIVVRAYDPTDRELPTGKQVAFWYTFTSGIWQTVWLEARPATYLSALKLVPQNRDGKWSLAVEVEVAGEETPARVRISSPDPSVAAAEGEAELTEGHGVYRAELAVSDPKPWTPETPHLYDLTVEVTGPDGATDTVQSYFGLRTIGRGKYGDLPYESILLNGEPVYLRGALDQSFNPDGIYTAPSDEFLRGDIERAKSVGLNFLRIHIKPDEPRRLYWADKLGILIMQDMPNTWRYSERAKAAWEATMREVIARDRNHPSIIAWCLFNETWGIGGNEYKKRPDIQEWVEGMWHEAKRLDPTRLVEDNSPNRRDHVITDLNSWHFYIDNETRAWKHIEEVVRNTYPGSTFNYAPGHRQGTEPLINSEYGAVGAGGGDRDISWGFRYLTTRLRRYEKIQGYVYTELTDVEFEHNGFFNYDRSPKEFGYDAWVEKMKVADLQREDFVGFDTPPVIVAEPAEDLSIPVFVSHWSDYKGEVLLKRWLIGADDLGREIRVNLDSRVVHWERYRVTPQEPLGVNLPDRPFAGAMAMELVGENGERLAANFVNVVIPARIETEGWRYELIDSRHAVLRVSPMDIHAAYWTGSGAPARLARRRSAGKFFIYGSGIVEYLFEVPKEVVEAMPERIGILVEMATKARDERLDWPQQVHPLDYPQTDGRKYPGAVGIYVNGYPLEPVALDDDPADARGVLSHMAKFQPGSYGYLVQAEMLVEGAPGFLSRLRRDPRIRVTFEVEPGPEAAGLSVYGARTGRYPLDPTLVIQTSRDIQKRK